jgi:hypothetical protein
LEERALQKGVPRTPDEFDKLVRGSPDSSFVWINYMAFLVDLGEVEKARSVAERYVCIIRNSLLEILFRITCGDRKLLF